MSTALSVLVDSTLITFVFALAALGLSVPAIFCHAFFNMIEWRQ